MSFTVVAGFAVLVWVITLAIHGLRDRVTALEKRLNELQGREGD